MNGIVQQVRLTEGVPLTEGLEVPALRLATRASVSALPNASVHQKTVQLGTVDPPVLALLKHWSKAVVVIIALLLAVIVTAQPLTPAYGALAVVTVLCARQIFSP